MKKIIIDTLASDKGPIEITKGAILAKRAYPCMRFVLVGEKKELLPTVLENGFQENDFEYLDTNIALSNKENPKDIIQKENRSSLALGLDELKNDEDSIGIVSSGSTGALLIGSIFRLGMLPHSKIPFLAARLFSFTRKPFILLDCGANLEMDPNMFLKAGKMGSVLISSLEGISNPRVAFLNVGKEKGKGNQALKDAYPFLEESTLNFVGNIEGNDVFMDKADVLLCDGFTGNVVLKMAEAFGKYSSKIISTLPGEEAGQLSKEVYSNFAYTELGASIFLGPKKICLKCHGSANQESILSAVDLLIKLEDGNFIPSLEKVLEN